uniref:sensor domain-containing diguanylate cyclase n=1 Tax=Agathobacter sp. TaxID=2021311 RepID=UPI004055AC7A
MSRTAEIMLITEKIVNEGLRISLAEKNPKTALEAFLKHLGQSSGSERIYIFEGKRNESVSNTFEWCAEGITEEKENLQNVPFEAVEWWYNAFEDKNCIIIKDLESIKESEPLTYAYLKPQNIHSLITGPLILENELIGFYGVDNPPPDIVDHLSDIAEIVGHFVVSLLEKERLTRKVETLRFMDSLTGFKNRLALNQDIDNYNVLFDVGILYCDVQGLRKVNDTLGNQAGDELLIRAGKCLQNLFPEADIYRAGGDEYLVLYIGIDEAAFKYRVKQLRMDMQEQNASMSIGAIWQKVITDLYIGIAEADDLMYQEKHDNYTSKNG